MTLYRIDEKERDRLAYEEQVGQLIYDKVLVPVEPCDCMNGWRCNCSWVDNGDGTRRADGEPCTTQTRCTKCALVGEETPNDCPIEREHECKRPCF